MEDGGELVGVVVIECFFFQEEAGIRVFCLSRGLGDVKRRQAQGVRQVLVAGVREALQGGT